MSQTRKPPKHHRLKNLTPTSVSTYTASTGAAASPPPSARGRRRTNPGPGPGPAPPVCTQGWMCCRSPGFLQDRKLEIPGNQT